MRVAQAASVVVALVVGALALAGAAPHSIDDGFITLVYARHFAGGGRIFWNAGEPPVDGFTSMLDMLVKAIAVRLFPGDPFRDAHAIAIACDLGAVLAGAALAVRASRGGGAVVMAGAAVASLAFGANIALADGTSYLLETPLYALTAIAAVGAVSYGDAASRGARAAIAIVLVLVALARPEGAAIAIVLGAAFAWKNARTIGVRSALVPLGAFALALAAYCAWHVVVFGHVAPNTFYAKSSDSRASEIADGLAYVGAYASGARGVALAAILASFGALFVPRAFVDRDARARFAIAAVAALVALLAVVWEGGDSYPGGRFLAAPIALAIAALAVAVPALAPKWRAIAILPLALFAIDGASRTLTHPRERLARIAMWPLRFDDDPRLPCERELADVLSPRVASIAQTDFQRIKFHADALRVIDLSSLNDPVRAHAAHAAPNRWGKSGAADAPLVGADVLALGLAFAMRAPVAAHSTERIVADPELAKAFLGVPLSPEARAALVARYRPMSMPACGGRYFFNLWVRDDVVPRFEDAPVVFGQMR